MPSAGNRQAVQAVQAAAFAFDGLDAAAERVANWIGNARTVLLGEASHGTHEFYHLRALITRRLIEDKSFTAVAAEADWPDAWRVNRYVRAFPDDPDADAALDGFKRFPQWMWRNHDVLDFVNWLRAYNGALPSGRSRVGFYGLDLYSLHASMHAVLTYLDKVDPAGARRARERYACFDHFGQDPQAYGYATTLGLSADCERQAVTQLVELRRRAPDYAHRDGRVADDEQFYAEQNAEVVRNAEQYYRVMFERGAASWNLRDRHMAQTLDALTRHLGRADPAAAKVVVWAHNSHLGDARATQTAREGQLNLGQLVRESHNPADAFLLGFTTHQGTVTAADDWGDPARRKRVRPSITGSYERLFHDTGVEKFLLDLRQPGAARVALGQPRLERAIGVVYRPQTERQSHYFTADLPAQFDAVIHFDTTTALHPLDQTAEWHESELPETYPTGV